MKQSGMLYLKLKQPFSEEVKAMELEEDAYGQEMWAYYKGKEVFEIVERDDGYIQASATTKVYFSEYEDWRPSEKKAMEFVKGKVLDIGCGAGRHSLHLQKKGFEVLGIDVSPLAIKICKLRGVKQAEIMAIEAMNVTSESFDTIIMLGNNFSLFGGFKKARWLLKKFHRMTSKNALIIAETRDPYKTDNPSHLEYHELNRKTGVRMCGELRIRIRFQKYTTKWFDYLMVSKKEMDDILKDSGWKVKEFIDSEDSQYIAIIEKTV